MKKQELFSKLIDYNNQLEKILEKKDFSEGVKNILLNIFYRIEQGYEDYHNVKREVEPKNIFIEKLTNIIEYDCDKITLIKPKTEASKILENKQVNYIINNEEKSIISYPNETYILYALFELNKKDIDIKDYIIKSIISFFELGLDINNTEVIRDFNGWSWITDIKDIQNIECNIVFQNMQLLLSNNFIQEFRKSKYNLNELKKEIYRKYKDFDYEKFVEIFQLFCLRLTTKKEEKKALIKKYNEIKEKFEEMQNKTVFLQKISISKKQATNQIKQIDKVLNNKELLLQEYKNRNKVLKNENKIFSLSNLEEILTNERNKLLEEIKEYNNIIDPRKFSERKADIDYFIKLIEQGILNPEPIYDYIIKIQNIFLEGLKQQIDTAITKKDIVDLIYKIRYYNLIKIKSDKYIKDLPEIQIHLEPIEKALITKACKMKILSIYDEDIENNFRVIKQVLQTRIINLENVVIEIVNTNIKIYDLDVLEQEYRLEMKNIKNKKIKLFN